MISLCSLFCGISWQRKLLKSWNFLSFNNITFNFFTDKNLLKQAQCFAHPNKNLKSWSINKTKKSIRLLNRFYKLTVTNKTVNTKQRKHIIKVFNTRHSAHHSPALIIRTVTVIKNHRLKQRCNMKKKKNKRTI